MTALAARGAFTGPRKALLENFAQLSIRPFPSSLLHILSLALTEFCVCVVGASLYLFLPPSIAVFPQRAAVPLGKLEKDFARFARTENGGLDEKVYFNKGL